MTNISDAVVDINHTDLLPMLAAGPTAAYPGAMINAVQIRAARALLGWNQERLAAEAGLSVAALRNFERGAVDPRVSTLAALERALIGAGIIFLDATPGAGGYGVRLRD
jgi:DNA-binding XRE family transcriptional regulator